MKKVRFGIIPAGGLGTRFLPASGAVPKELFPIFDTPLLDFAIEEMQEAGVETLFVIVSPWKKSIFERYFGIADELQERLSAQGKSDLQKKIAKMQAWPKIKLVVQSEPQGLAQALALCQDEIGSETFCVILPDEVLLFDPADSSADPWTASSVAHSPISSAASAPASSVAGRGPLACLLEVHRATGKSCVGLYQVSQSEVHNYGVAQLSESPLSLPTLNAPDQGKVWDLLHLVEKPKAEEAPSLMMLPGRYLFTSGFWQVLEEDLRALSGIKKFSEIHITDALDRLAQAQGLLGVELKHDRFDAGRPQGLLKLNIHYAKQSGAEW